MTRARSCARLGVAGFAALAAFLSMSLGERVGVHLDDFDDFDAGESASLAVGISWNPQKECGPIGGPGKLFEWLRGYLSQNAPARKLEGPNIAVARDAMNEILSTMKTTGGAQPITKVSDITGFQVEDVQGVHNNALATFTATPDTDPTTGEIKAFDFINQMTTAIKDMHAQHTSAKEDLAHPTRVLSDFIVARDLVMANLEKMCDGRSLPDSVTPQMLDVWYKEVRGQTTSLKA